MVKAREVMTPSIVVESANVSRKKGGCRAVMWWIPCLGECMKTKKGPYPCGIQSFQNAFKQMRAITYADRGP